MGPMPRAALTYDQLVEQFSQAVVAASNNAAAHQLESRKVLVLAHISLTFVQFDLDGTVRKPSDVNTLLNATVRCAGSKLEVHHPEGNA